MEKKKILFIDRDGTILREPPEDFQVDTPEKFGFLPGVIGALSRLVKETDYRLVMVSNQDGMGTERFPPEHFRSYQRLMLDILAGEGVIFEEVLIGSSFPEENLRLRKPGTEMVDRYLNGGLDYEHSYVIGDRKTDMQLAARMGIKGIYLGEEIWTDLPVVLRSGSWEEICNFLKEGSRKAAVVRKTSETEIYAEVNLNGKGIGKIHTGIAFFDHMLEQICRHGNVDLCLEVKGDLEVDEHHTIEDTGMVLGECFHKALGIKNGIERYGYALPMDDAEAKVLLDFGGRSYLKWEVEFTREYVGGFPTEMARHFFDSFCQGGKCNLHISAEGENMHHLLEAVFKAFARCIGKAIRQTGTGVPSSKGKL